jgi:hypothetical protein
MLGKATSSATGTTTATATATATGTGTATSSATASGTASASASGGSSSGGMSGSGRKPAFEHLLPQHAPGAKSSGVKNADCSIPLSIFPISPDRICICFCGLPGRGKTHISRRLGQYLSFFHALNVKIFNVGEYRRKMFGACKNAEWFDVQNAEALRMREECNAAALADMVQFFEEVSTGASTNSLGIFDGTNASRAQRASIQQKVSIAAIY